MKAKVCFVLDCTASMSEHFEMAKYKIRDIMHDLLNEGLDMLISILAYRDFEDKDKIEKLNFTDRFERIEAFLNNLEAKGGERDEAEDVLEVYQYLNCIEWDTKFNLIFHIADAPAHGHKYHDSSVSDEFPLPRLTKELDNEVELLAYKDVSLTLFKINDSTDIMYDRFTRIFNSARNGNIIILDFETE